MLIKSHLLWLNWQIKIFSRHSENFPLNLIYYDFICPGANLSGPAENLINRRPSVLNTVLPLETDNSCLPYKMTNILQTTFSNVLSWMKIFIFHFKFHWGLFFGKQLNIRHHWFQQWHRAGDKRLPEPLMSWTGTEMHYPIMYVVSLKWCHILPYIYTCYDVFKGLRPVLEGFVGTMHEGACETGSTVRTSPSALWQQNPTDRS